MNASDIEAEVRSYLLKNILPDCPEEALAPDAPLISSGLLDSVSVLALVGHLEDQHDVIFGAHEVSPDHIDTLAAIATIVRSKREAK